MRRIETLYPCSRSGWLKNPENKTHAILLVLSFMLAAISPSATAQPAPGGLASGTDATEIVWKMVAQNATRAQQLHYFTSLRHYHVDFNGWGRFISADMHVEVSYHAGSGKTFRIVDESGSRLLLNHVLRKLLETEQIDSRQQTAGLTPFNYNFTFDGETNEGGRPLYVFSVEPKRKNKLLYRGKVWIDARDYAVARVDAEPAENPSFWIRDTEIHHTYAKSGDFWLPQSNRSESKVRLGGTAVLTIDYGSYQFDEPHELTPAATNEVASHSTLLGVQ